MADWMSQVPGNLLLSELSIPGTHDSCCRVGSIKSGVPVFKDFVYCQFQDYDIPAQLKAGVRYFDFRMKNAGNLTHGIARLHGNFFSEVKRCVDFLDQNPGECVLASSKWEKEKLGEKPTPEPAKEVEWVINQLKSLFGASRFWFERRTPTLDEARGKIVFLSRWNSDTGEGIRYSPGGDNLVGLTPFRSQDRFDLTDVMQKNPSKDKWEKSVLPFIERARSTSNEQNVWYYNYLSAYAGQPPIKYITPNKIAWGDKNMSGINNYLEEYLGKTPSPARLGILIIDFINTQVARAIFTKNLRRSGSW